MDRLLGKCPKHDTAHDPRREVTFPLTSKLLYQAILVAVLCRIDPGSAVRVPLREILEVSCAKRTVLGCPDSFTDLQQPSHDRPVNAGSMAAGQLFELGRVLRRSRDRVRV